MARKENLFKVEFSVDNISLKKQQEIFENLLKQLDYNERQALHIVVTDPIGGQHMIWDNKGVDADGVVCKECRSIDCRYCFDYERRQKNGD